MFAFLRKESSEDKELRKRLHSILGFQPHNMALYHLALTHSSAGLVVKDGVPLSNERLEFLGDAMLGAIAAKYLFKRFPFESEGFLTETRSKIVSRKNLGGLASKLGLRELVKKEGSLDSGISSLGGDALEALVGAAFMDKGFELTERFVVSNLIDNFIDLDQLLKEDANFKSRIIEYCQKRRQQFSFLMLHEQRSKGDRLFEAQLLINGQPHGRGKGRTKKEAEQAAAREACQKLGILEV
ncbi:MAG: ribonuclease III [Flavobacteriales bacterium]|nr:ribonuclease III [Flavobacteriales bacterium]